MLLDFLHFGFLLLPESVGLFASDDNSQNDSLLSTDKNELQLSAPIIGQGSHASEGQFIKFQAVFHVDVLVSLLVDGVIVDIIFIEGHLGMGRTVSRSQIHQLGLLCLHVVVQQARVQLPLDVHLHLVAVDVLEELRFSTHDLVILSSLDGVFCKHRHSLLIALQFGLSSGLFWILLVFERVL